MKQFSTVIVSNRLPVNIGRVNGKLTFEPSSGGLATAMSSLENDDQVWVGWPGIADDDLTDAEKDTIIATLEREYNYVPVFLSNEEVQQFYEGYSNDTLWPMFHYFQSLAHHDPAYWQAYQTVNQRFAEVAATYAAADALVWIQDYQLMLTPMQLRELLPEASIGFFLHIPFPSFEIFRLLPERKQLLQGLLGADVIGFHIYDYGRHFLSSCMRLLGLPSSGGFISYDDRQIKVSPYPIGIDFDKFREQLRSRDTKLAIAELDDSYKNEKLLLSIDRLDYSKGIPERLEAFRLLLEQRPEHHGKIKLLMIAVPSRTNVETYMQLRDDIERTVSRINGTFGTVGWAPISYQFQNRPFHEIVALFARADIALVTPIRDGMNLVAKEYVASKKRRNGVLILSEMTGAMDEMPEALSINPNDTESIAQAIHHALTMPGREQRRRLKAMQERIKVSTVQNWGKEFMNDLEIAAGRHDQFMKKQLSPSQQVRIVTRSRNAASRLIILDYDGTLKSFVNTPRALAATPSLRLRRIIKRLSEQPNTTVAIVSGRPKKALSRWFIGLNIILAAEHGAWTRYDRKWEHIDSTFHKHKKRLKSILQQYVDKTKGAEIEEKDYSLVWHHTNVEPELAYTRAASLKHELTDQLMDEDISVHSGRNILEIKPGNVSKAKVVAELMRRFPSEFVLCAGDDYTDEDMFDMLDENAVTIHVGGGDTKALNQLPTVASMVSLLEQLAPEPRLPKLPLPKLPR